MTIGLIRHGESEANAHGLLSSNPADPYPLTTAGKKQIVTCITDPFFTTPPTAIYTSPFVRTRESAVIISDELARRYQAQYPIIQDERIAEMNFGAFSGRTVEETDAEVRTIFEQAFAGDYEIRMSPSGENRREFLSRAYSFLLFLLETYDEDARIVVVTHSSIIAVLEKLWIRLKSPSFIRSSTKNAELKLIEFQKSDKESIESSLRSTQSTHSPT